MKRMLIVLLAMLLAIFFIGCPPDGGDSGDGGTVEYTLTVVPSPSSAGNVVKNPAGPTYPADTIVVLTPNANSGYVFDDWGGTSAADVIDDNNGSYHIVMNSDKSLEAYFIPTYTLTIIATNGSVTKNPDMENYPSGIVVTLTPVPDSSYIFVNWSGANAGNLVNNGNGTYNITMNSNKSLTANFVQPLFFDSFETGSFSSAWTVGDISVTEDYTPVVIDGTSPSATYSISWGTGGFNSWDTYAFHGDYYVQMSQVETSPDNSDELPITSNNASYIQFSVNVPSGTATLYYNYISCFYEDESGYTSFKIYDTPTTTIDYSATGGTTPVKIIEVLEDNYSVDWKSDSISLSAGIHYITFCFWKNTNSTWGCYGDTLFIDNVRVMQN